MPDVVTANLLRSGDVVYLAGGGRWVRRLADASVATDKDTLARLEATAAASAARQDVTAVYTMTVGLDGAVPIPVSQRERIRAAHGPTV
jgi:sulfite reductase (NADPH) hemoprotein beta-component